MGKVVSRVGLRAKPADNHPEYKEWETANVVVFVQTDGRDETLVRAREVLRRERWEVLEVQLCDRLIEDRVREQGGEVWELYQAALTRGAAIKVLPQNFAAGRTGILAIRPPRVTEVFIDQVVADAGGQRLDTDNQNRIADYRIDEWLFELKDLQEEGLLQPTRQEKLAKLFVPYATQGVPLLLDPAILPEEDRRRYFDILSGPIQTQVKSASKQVRSTKSLLGDEALRGGVIYLNTGYGSFPPEEFGPMVERYARKDTTQIEAVFCISTWSVTIGFDSQIFFRTYPTEPTIPALERLGKAFATRFEEAMTQLVLGTLPQAPEFADPLTPVAFNVNGLDFSWLPPTLPATWATGGVTGDSVE